MMQKIDYENITSEQENELVKELKRSLRTVVHDYGYFNNGDKPDYIAKYALLELAAEISFANGDAGLFLESAKEVDDVFTADSERFTTY